MAKHRIHSIEFKRHARSGSGHGVRTSLRGLIRELWSEAPTTSQPQNRLLSGLIPYRGNYHGTTKAAVDCGF